MNERMNERMSGQCQKHVRYACTSYSAVRFAIRTEQIRFDKKLVIEVSPLPPPQKRNRKKC